MAGESSQVQRLSAYYTAPDNGGVEAKLKELVVKDRFGTSGTCEFTRLVKMPMTETGDIDREMLLKWATRGREVGAEPTMPRNDFELRIAAIMKEVLNIGQVGIHDNFFGLGGNSLLATQVLSRVRDAFGISLSLRNFFEHSTVAKLATLITESDTERSVKSKDIDKIERSDPQALLEKLDTLTDEQVATLLAQMQEEQNQSS